MNSGADKYIKLSEGDAVLAFMPHRNASTATFDVYSPLVRVDAVAPPYTNPARRVGACTTNIDIAAATELRDALDAWIASALSS